MKLSPLLVLTTSAIFTPVFTAFALETVQLMMPWLVVMLCVIITDLVAGVRKSLKFGVHVSWSTACRETFGKIVVYFAFAVTAAVVDVAAHGDTLIAKWCCLAVIAIEGGSIMSNILKPHGIELSIKGVLKYILFRFGVSHEDAEEILDEQKWEEMRERERDRWNRKGKKGRK